MSPRSGGALDILIVSPMAHFQLNPSNGPIKLQIDTLDDPGDEEAVDRAFGKLELMPAGTVFLGPEPHPPTTLREIWSWYLYEGANQPYSTYVIS